VSAIRTAAPRYRMEALLPPGWERGTTPGGVSFFIDHNTQTTSWQPPELPGYSPPAGTSGVTAVGARGALGYSEEVLADLCRRLANKEADLRTIAALDGVGPEQLRPLEAEITSLREAIGSHGIPEAIPPTCDALPAGDPMGGASRAGGGAVAAVVDIDRLKGKIERTRSTLRIFAEMGEPTQSLQVDIDQMLAQLHAAGGAMPVEMAECSVCMDDCPADTMFDWGCPHHHRLCIAEDSGQCALGLVTAAIGGGTVPVCPVCSMENPEADNTMDRGKLRELVGHRSDLWAKYKEIEMRGFVERGIGGEAGGGGGLVACPGTDCGNFLLLGDDVAAKVECVCDQDGGCGARFCSLCREPYHRHGTTCEEARQIKANWLNWVATGRVAYAVQLGQDAAGVNAAAQQEAASRIANMQADEAWKAANCRLCPSCGRVVNKLSGCDSMRCGQDAHGGNVQNGCGASFSWSSAKLYRAANAAATTTPMQTVTVESLIMRGQHDGIACSLCGCAPLSLSAIAASPSTPA
jgi:hypothetical protein